MKSFVWYIAGLLMQEKLLLEYLVTSPHVNELGYYRVPIEYMMVDLGMPRSRVETALESLINKELISYDQSTSMVAVANFNRYNYSTVRNPMDTLFCLPKSGAFSVCLAWLKKVLHNSAVQSLEEDEWVKTALAMDVPTFERKVTKKKKVTVKSETLFNEGGVVELPVRTETTTTFSENTKQLSIIPSDTTVVVSNENNVTVESEQPKVEAAPAEVAKAPEQDSIADTITTTNNTETANTVSAEVNQDIEDKEEKKSDKKKEPKVDPVTQQHTEEFEALWKRYPRKNGKSYALKGYLQMVKSGELTFAIASKALDNYLHELRVNNTEDKFIIGGRSFFGKEQSRIMEYVIPETSESSEDADKQLKLKLMPEFNMFWCIYPKKVGKEIAENNFTEIIKSGDFTANQLIEAARAYTSECRAKNTAERYIKRGDLFLDPKTRPFRDYLDREDLNSFYNVHSGEMEQMADNGIEAMEEMLAEAEEERKAKGENTAASNYDSDEDIKALENILAQYDAMEQAEKGKKIETANKADAPIQKLAPAEKQESKETAEEDDDNSYEKIARALKELDAPETNNNSEPTKTIIVTTQKAAPVAKQETANKQAADAIEEFSAPAYDVDNDDDDALMIDDNETYDFENADSGSDDEAEESFWEPGWIEEEVEAAWA